MKDTAVVVHLENTPVNIQETTHKKHPHRLTYPRTEVTSMIVNFQAIQYKAKKHRDYQKPRNTKCILWP